jgi:hypothetical protein
MAIWDPTFWEVNAPEAGWEPPAVDLALQGLLRGFDVPNVLPRDVVPTGLEGLWRGAETAAPAASAAASATGSGAEAVEQIDPALVETAVRSLGAGGGGSWWEPLRGALGTAEQVARQVAPVAQLGLGVLGGITGIQAMRQAAEQTRIARQAQQRMSEAAQPAVAAAQQLTPAGAAAVLGGALPPGLEAQVEQWKNDMRARLRQHAANAGLDDSTQLAQWEGLIDLQAQQLRQSLAQSLLAGGLEAVGAATGPESRVLTSALGQSQAAAQAVAEAQRRMMEYLARA